MIDNILYDISLIIERNPMIIMGVIAIGMVVILGAASSGSKGKGKSMKGKGGKKVKVPKEFGKMSKQEVNRLRGKGGAVSAHKAHRRTLPTKVKRKESRAKAYTEGRKAAGKIGAIGGGRDLGTKKVKPVGGNLNRAMREQRKMVDKANKEKAKALQEGKKTKKKKKKDGGKDTTGLGFGF